MPRAVDLVPQRFDLSHDPSKQLSPDVGLQRAIGELSSALEGLSEMVRAEIMRVIETLIGLAANPIPALQDWVDSLPAVGDLLRLNDVRAWLDELVNGNDPGAEVANQFPPLDVPFTPGGEIAAVHSAHSALGFLTFLRNFTQWNPNATVEEAVAGFAMVLLVPQKIFAELVRIGGRDQLAIGQTPQALFDALGKITARVDADADGIPDILERLGRIFGPARDFLPALFDPDTPYTSATDTAIQLNGTLLGTGMIARLVGGRHVDDEVAPIVVRNTERIDELSARLSQIATPAWVGSEIDMVAYPRVLLWKRIGAGDSMSCADNSHTHVAAMPSFSPESGKVYFVPQWADRRGILRRMKFIVSDDGDWFGSIDALHVGLYSFTRTAPGVMGGTLAKLWDSGNIKSAYSPDGFEEFDPDMGLGDDAVIVPGALVFYAMWQDGGGFFGTTTRPWAGVGGTGVERTANQLIQAECYTLAGQPGLPDTATLSSLTKDTSVYPWFALTVEPTEES